MRKIMTASWFAKLPAGATLVGTSRGVPRGMTSYKPLRALEPGLWFKSVSPTEYLTRYRQILDRLDPEAIRDQLFAFGDTPVMLCFEKAADCQCGKTWCHRHLVAQWLEDSLGIEVLEVGHPNLDRFAYLRNLSIPAPSFKTASRSSAKIGSDNDKYRS